MSELNLPCSPGGTLIDLHMDSLSDSDDGQDDVKKRKLPITDKGRLISKPNSKSSIWRHFKVWSNLCSNAYSVANCNLCDVDVISKLGNTSHLARHMERDHRKVMNDSRLQLASSAIENIVSSVDSDITINALSHC